MSDSQQILKSHHLRATSHRLAILDFFLRKEVALSQPELEQELAGTCDRVTIYRTLSHFLEKGIAHKVLDNAGAMKYALCQLGCEEQEAHAHDHVHFKCNKCGKTRCLEEVSIPNLQLPEGFYGEEINVLIQGICPACD
ncbi:MAG: transcriptional repressor [Bacteroidota bacterium]